MSARRSPWLPSIIGVVGILVVGRLVAQPAPGWSTETVDSAGSDGAFHSVAVSPITGFPTIAYSGTSGRKTAVKLATWNGASWAIQVVESGVSSEAISLAFDSAGNPAISYGNGQLRFARWTGSSWSIQAVDSSSGIVSSLAFHNGQASIAYGYSVKKGNNTTNQLRLATLAGSTWTVEAAVDGVAVLYPSLAFAPDGHPSIAYAAGGQLRLAQKTGSTWSSQSIEAGGTYANVAYDPLTGYATIAHMSGSSGVVRFDRWDGSQWVLEVVDANQATQPSLAYDSGGVAAISYQVAPGPNGHTQLWFARRTGCSGSCWTTQLIQDFSPVQLYRATSLAFAPTGAAAISFGDYTNGDLKFAQQTP